MIFVVFQIIFFLSWCTHAQLSSNIEDVSRSTATWRTLQNEDIDNNLSIRDKISKRKIPSFIQNERNHFHNAILDDLESILIGNETHHYSERNLQKDEYHPFRVGFITTELEDQRDDERIQYLMDTVLPEVKDFYSKLLKVKPLPDPSIDLSDVTCFGPDVKLPQDLKRNGVRDADVAIYVKAEDCGIQGAIAGASVCTLSARNFRPVVGVMTYCLDSDVLKSIDPNDPEVVSVSIHEIAHVLGMNSQLYPFYLNPDTGETLVKNIRTQSAPSVVMCTDGVARRVLMPSSEVLQRSESSNGARHYEVVTPTVKTIVRNQFDCQELTGARLENQPTAPTDCFGSHWDERLFFTESMSAILGWEHNAFSSLTLALLEDTGWYKGNYEMTTMSTFGLGAGCGFVNEDCINEDGSIPSSSKGFFCNSLSSLRHQSLQCTPTHGGIGYCDLFDFKAENLDERLLPPKEFQYLSTNSISPLFFSQADYCPITLPLEAGECKVDDSTDGEIEQMCVNIDSNRRNFVVECVQFKCNKDLKKLQMSTFDSNDFLTCDHDFQMLDHPMVPFAKMECPRLAVMCPEFVCPSNCSGKGICDYSLDVPSCVCFDKADKSASCESDLSPQTSQPSLSPSMLPSANPSVVPTYVEFISNPETSPGNESSSFESDKSSSVYLSLKVNLLLILATKFVLVWLII